MKATHQTLPRAALTMALATLTTLATQATPATSPAPAAVAAAGTAGAAAPASHAQEPVAAAPPAAPPRVTVESGTLEGFERDGVRVFAGVPYAAPPVGALRWRPPQPPLHWSGERSATQPGPTCMQPVDAAGISRGEGPVSEDCLTLQVFAPKSAHQAPVMVWMHGGGNVDGSSSKKVYDGASFARDGIVLVAINYRLGALGFFAHPALTRLAQPNEPLANYGLMDQIAALRWVFRNVSAFGGDPHNVTVFGESAGGLDVLALMAAPAARGLFVRVAAESPGGAWEHMQTLAEAEAAGVRSAAAAGLGAGASAEELRAIPAARLVSKGAEALEPVVDGRLLTDAVPRTFARGEAAAVPLLLGSNSYEASLLGVGVTFDMGPLPAALRSAYVNPDDPATQAAIFGDREFTAPVRWFARQAARRAPVWLYYFSYVRVSQRQKTPGAPHGSELPYVFDSWDAISARARFLPAEDRAMTALVHSCWVAFARTGTPVCQGAPAWPAYSERSDDLMELGGKPEVRRHLRQTQLDAQDRAAVAGAAAAP